jgi:hypothetical protein
MASESKTPLWSWETFLSVGAAFIVAGVLVSLFHHILDRAGKNMTGHTSSDASGTAVPPASPNATAHGGA